MGIEKTAFTTAAGSASIALAAGAVEVTVGSPDGGVPPRVVKVQLKAPPSGVPSLPFTVVSSFAV